MTIITPLKAHRLPIHPMFLPLSRHTGLSPEAAMDVDSSPMCQLFDMPIHGYRPVPQLQAHWDGSGYDAGPGDTRTYSSPAVSPLQHWR
mmetsp:Transcript_50048/g.89428  ORF Transcript_50048/g.89428 Transcript_50048/m.89428 type:complete len:89 (-) Transcript_50048:155-421(-)